MRTSLFYLFTFATFTPALATEPCMPLDEPAFRAQVLAKSNTVLAGTVADYSSGTFSFMPRWTRLEQVQVLKGETLEKTIKIMDWQAFDQPLYPYEKGQRLVVFLRHAGKGVYRLTDIRWKHCVPSVFPANAEGKAYLAFTPEDQTLRNTWVPIDKLRHTLFDTPQKQ